MLLPASTPPVRQPGSADVEEAFLAALGDIAEWAVRHGIMAADAVRVLRAAAIGLIVPARSE
jgi:hypothetical protein